MRLGSLEARLRELLEVRLLRLLPDSGLQSLITRRLADAIRQNVIVEGDGTNVSPDVFTFVVHPESAGGWKGEPVVDAIRGAVHVAVEDAGLRLRSSPTLAIAVDEAVRPRDIRIVASHTIQSPEETSTSAAAVRSDDAAPDLQGAYFIIQGVRIHQVGAAVTNVGRRLDNHLVLDDPRVSRSHAQVRLINGRFVIFDLGSTGGTFVNNQRVTQCELRPGDVVSLAGLTLVFGMDTPGSAQDHGETAPGSPLPGSDRTTLQAPPPAGRDANR